MAVINAAEEEALKRETTRQRPSRFSAPEPSAPSDDGIAPFTRSGVHATALAPVQPSWYDQLLHLLDEKSGGRAEELVRIAQFLLVGGTASLLNLVCVGLLDRVFHPTGVMPVFFVILAATEISLLANFMLNDRFTFRSLVGEHRTWLQRCIRFHGPASVGFVLTLVISNSVHHFVTYGHGKHLPLVVGQAIAIVIVTFVNFFMHRNWTYREVKTA